MLFTVLRSVIRLPSALSILILTGTPSISPVIITCLSPAMYCIKTGSFTARSIIIEACLYSDFNSPAVLPLDEKISGCCAENVGSVPSK